MYHLDVWSYGQKLVNILVNIDNKTPQKDTFPGQKTGLSTQ